MTTARREDESFEDYKQRQKDDTMALKQQKHGKLFWDSETQGTYINYEKRERKAQKAKQ